MSLQCCGDYGLLFKFTRSYFEVNSGTVKAKGENGTKKRVIFAKPHQSKLKKTSLTVAALMPYKLTLVIQKRRQCAFLGHLCTFFS
jgi:hypothetical protein